MRLNSFTAAAMAAIAFVPVAVADVATLTASADATLYEEPDGLIGNSKGQYLFAGRTAFAPTLARRALIRFDLSSIPAGSTIDAVEVRMRLSRTISADQPVALHRATTNWAEGTSAAVAEEGGGTLAEPGDPTWVHASYPGTNWANIGGDFVATASGVQMVGATIGSVFSWSSPGLLADVAGWHDGSLANFGWTVLGNEVSDVTAKRFDSRDGIGLGAMAPTLVVTFTPPPPCVGDYNGDNMVTFADITLILALFGTPYTFGDITVVLANFGNAC